MIPFLSLPTQSCQPIDFRLGRCHTHMFYLCPRILKENKDHCITKYCFGSDTKAKFGDVMIFILFGDSCIEVNMRCIEEHNITQPIYIVWLLMKTSIQKMKEHTSERRLTADFFLQMIQERLLFRMLFAMRLRSCQQKSVGPATFDHNIINSLVNHWCLALLHHKSHWDMLGF